MITCLKNFIGASKNQARVVSIAEEDKLWSSSVMGCHSPLALQNAVFFLCGILLCLRGGEEHRNMKVTQFVIDEVENPWLPSEKIKRLTYTENGSKNRSGGMHQVHLDNKVVHHYANGSIGNRCLLLLVELYISKLPESAFEKELFYCRPVPVKHMKDDKPWYYDTPVGHNILKTKLKVMFEAVGLDAGGISNHSLRATGVTRMYDKGVPEKIIMERSGHLSISGVHSYERTTCLQQKQVSDVLTSSSSTYDPVKVKDDSDVRKYE